MTKKNGLSDTGEHGGAPSMRRSPWRVMLPVLTGLAFVVLGAILVLVYRSGTDDVGGGTGPPGASGPPNLGTAPLFSLPAVDGRTLSLADFAGSQNVLLFFNEGVM